MNATLQNGYKLRPAKSEDLQEVTALLNACSIQETGIERFVASDVEGDWTSPGLDVNTDTCVVIAPDGKLAGYYAIFDPSEPHVHIYLWGRVHPEYVGRGIGSALLEWAENRARLSLPKAPPRARVILQANCLSSLSRTQELFLNNGFAIARYSLRMVIDLDETMPDPQWPQGISVKPMTRGQDERAVVQAVRDSFKDHWGYVETPFEKEYARWLHYLDSDPDADPDLWFMAMDGDQVAGISLCRRQINDDPEMGWVNTLGVLRPWRRQGLGLALLQHSFQTFRRLGKSRAGLGVDAQSLTGATRLYTKAGMQPDPKWQFTLFDKELRPGIEIGTQALE